MTLVKTPLNESSARRIYLYLTKHNFRKIKKFKPLAGFQPAIPASERLQTHTLDHAATGIGTKYTL
jgi:hypothetical protein